MAAGPKPVAAPKQREAKPARKAASKVVKPNSLPEADSVVAAAPVTESNPNSPTSALLSNAGMPIEAISLLFDVSWYCSKYPDVVAAKIDPIRHFFDNGAREGRNPNAYFATAWYVSVNADVAASKMNPFLHYLLYGAKEGRRPRP